MAETTAIEWCHKTWSPFIGCTKVSPGCLKCHAERDNNRRKWVEGFGKGIPRKRTSEAYWRKPYKWDRRAAQLGERYRVFPSLCDPFDEEVPTRWKNDFFNLVYDTPNLDWLILTKRIEQAKDYFHCAMETIYKNLWLGVSAEDQKRYDERRAIIKLMNPAIKWISIEPLIGPIEPHGIEVFDWVVLGGESDYTNPRPCETEWLLKIIERCENLGIPVFLKQLGGTRKINGSWGGHSIGGKTWRQFPTKKELTF